MKSDKMFFEIEQDLRKKALEQEQKRVASFDTFKLVIQLVGLLILSACGWIVWITFS